MVYWGLKMYVYLIDLYQQGIRDNKTLAQMTKYHPFAIGKAMKHIDRLLRYREEVFTLFRGLVDLDYAIKSGKLPGAVFWLELKKLIYQFAV